MIVDRDLPTRAIADLIDTCQPGWSLPGPFYSEEAIYRLDLARVWRRGWLFAGHTGEIPEPGDYLTVPLDTDSVILIRGDDGQVRGFHNLCRHRGSLLCPDAAGHVGKLVCPYHQWAYARDGRLLACRGMPDDLDKGAFGLVPVPVGVIEGMIFFSLAAHPPDFAAPRECLGPLVRPQGLERAKVAKTIDYEVAANWKLVWENNRECYHCNVNHPQYIKANWDHYNADDATERVQQAVAAAVARSERHWAAAGLAVTHREAGMAPFPDAERNVWYSANRTPLVDGYLSESLDGRPVAPLMGDYPDHDVGTLRIRTMPNCWNHSSCDHAVTTRLLPAGPRRTRVRVTWLVDRGAEEGRDYSLEALLPFWQLTSEQDWAICANQQRGVESSAYRPGPYSPYKEYNVDRFVRWYLKQLGTP
jgi:Rieske 2Fe-2S family protein